MDGEHTSLSARFAERIRQREIHGPLDLDDLDTIVGPGLRFLLARRALPDIDHVSKTILGRAAALLRLQVFIDPATLPSYVLAAMNELRLPDCPVKIDSRQPVTREVNEVLAALDENEREALVQFYGQEQPSTQICREMGLTEESLSVLRSRVKAAISMGHKNGRTVLGAISNPGSGQV
jgi:hypothetical protein